MKTFLCAAMAAATLALAPALCIAQYPAKPIRIVVPFAAGGASDTAARVLGQSLSKSIGQSVVIENKPGANGAIAAQAVLAAPPDGYTLLWGVGSMEALALVMKAPPYATLADLTPISTVGRFTFAMFVHPSVPAKSLAEFLAYARANPDKLSFASSTLSEHLAAAQLMRSAGISMVRVPYKGGAQAMPDLVAGRIHAYITPVALGLPHARENRLRVLATVLPQRTAATSDIPTFGEAGVRGVSVPTWQALFGPPKMPRPLVERLAREINLALKDPALRTQMEQQTLHIEGSTPEALDAAIREEHQEWARFIRENGISPE